MTNWHSAGDPVRRASICHLSLIRGRPRGLSRLHDYERLLAISGENNDHRTTGIELLSDFLEIFGRRDPLIIDCLDDVAGL